MVQYSTAQLNPDRRGRGGCYPCCHLGSGIWDGGGGLSLGLEKRRQEILVVVRVGFHKLSLGFVCLVCGMS